MPRAGWGNKLNPHARWPFWVSEPRGPTDDNSRMARYNSLVAGLSGLQHYWPLTETSGTRFADLLGTASGTWGADVSTFLTIGPDGVTRVPVNNASATRVGITSAFAPPATATWFWWQRQDADAIADNMIFEWANSPTFSQFIQGNYGYSGTGVPAAGQILFSVNYGSVSGALSTNLVKEVLGQWSFYCLQINPSLGTASGAIWLWRNGMLLGRLDQAEASQSGLTPTSGTMGVLGRNNNGTRSLPISAAMCGFGCVNRVLTQTEMFGLLDAMVLPREVVRLERHYGDVNGWNHNAFPGADLAPDNRTLVIGYQHANQHAATEGTIRVRRVLSSTGSAIDVQDVRTVLAADPDTNLGDVSVWTMNNGEMGLLWNESSTPGVADLTTVVKQMAAFSSDNGLTWSTPAQLTTLPFPSNGSGVAGAYGIAPSPPAELTDGTLVLAMYGFDDKTQIQTTASPGYVKAAQSTDRGRTWTVVGTPFPASASDRDYDEATMYRRDDGALTSTARTFYYPSGRGAGSAYVLMEATSYDGGRTWDAPHISLGSGTIGATGYGGRPTVTQGPNGVMLATFREMQANGTSGFPGLRLSVDRAQTWLPGVDPYDFAPERVGQAPAGYRGVEVYSAAAPTVGTTTDTDEMAVVWAEEINSALTSALYFRTVRLPPPALPVSGMYMWGTSAASAGGSGTLTAPAASGANLSGTSAAAASSSGGLTAASQLSGTSAAAASAAGALRAASLLSGSSAAAAGGSGQLTAPALMTGMSAAGASSSGALTAASQMSGSSAAAASSSGSLTAASRLSGASGAAASSAGALTASSLMTGTGVAAAGGSGALTASSRLTGSSPAAAGGTGALTAASLLSGASAAAAGSSGALTAASQLSGASAAAASSSGTLATSNAPFLFGTSAAAGSSAGALTASSLLSGTGAAAAGGTGLLTAAALISGVSAAAAASSGALTSASQLAGTSAAAASGSGALMASSRMTGTGGAAASSAGALTAASLLTGTSPAVASSSGLLTAAVSLSGASTAQAGGAGLLTAASALSGSGAAQAGGSGNLTVPGAALLLGTGAAAASSSASLTASSRMTGAGVAVADGSGILTASSRVTGASSAAASSSGLLTSAAQVSGSSSASATGTGSLRVSAALSGSSAAAGGGSGALRSVSLLSGQSPAASLSTGGLSARALMSGSSAAGAAGAGLMTVAVRLSGASAAVAQGTGELVIGVKNFDRFAGGGVVGAQPGYVRGARAGRLDGARAGTIGR